VTVSRRVALLIATYSYQDPELSQLISPAHDAEALAAVLKDPDIAGFEVTTLVNQPHHLVGQALGDFYARRRGEDLALVYFTGHGLKDEEGDLYFAMTDTRRDSLLFTALSADHVNRAMDTSPSRQKVLVLDCCYSGAFPPGRTAKADTQVNALERFRGRGRVVLTASDSTQYAFEGSHLTGQGEPSVFTRHFVAGLRTGQADLDNDGDITLDELYAYVYDRVTAEIPRQRPKKLANVEGTIVLARNVHWTPSTPSTPSAPSTPPRSAPARPAARAPRARPAVLLEFPFECPVHSMRGRWLATARGPGQADNEVWLWDLKSRQLRHVLTHDRRVNTVSLNPAGTSLRTSCKEGGTLQLWDTESGELRHILARGYALWSSDFSPDGTCLAACGKDDRMLRLWDVASGELRHALAHPRPVRSLRFSPDGSWIAATGEKDDTVRVWDVASGRSVTTLVQDQPIGWCSFSPDRRWLTIAVASEAPQLWDASAGRPATAHFRDGPTTWPDFSPDGRRLATTSPVSGPLGVWVWNVATGVHMQTVRAGERIWEVTFSPKADLLATGTSDGNSPVVCDVATGQPRYSLGHPAEVLHVTFSPDGGTLAAGCHAEGSVPLWDAATGRHLHTLACGAASRLVTFAFSPDGRLLSTRSWPEEKALVWDVATGQPRHTFPHRGLLMAHFSEDSRRLTTRGKDTSIVWEL
jgi:WD40 repeat protein